MLSRVAESVLWMNRYIERLENNARFLDVNFNLALDLPPELKQQWKPLIQISGAEEKFEELYSEYSKANVISFICFDERNSSSILSCITHARENARALRSSLTKEIWEQINSMYHTVLHYKGQDATLRDDPRAFVDKIRQASQLYYGINDNTVSQNEAWHFGKVGSYLERADNISRILDVKYHILLPSVKSVGTTLDWIQWVALLKSASAFNMYSRKYGEVKPYHVAEFLVLDPEFPRSIYYCLEKANQSLHAISENFKSGYSNQAEKLIGMLISEISYSGMEDIFKKGLHEFLDLTQLKIIEVGNAIHETYFSLKS
ncbi:MAG: alpha-E domain-containing protein [Saprospiraceae bacterium]|nr:alpha-E domain-containing protein [Saprospiraceae bacterium]